MQLLLNRFPGSTAKDQAAAMHRNILSFYMRVPPSNRPDHLTPLMIKKPGNKSPKLEGNAGEVRSLVPWAVEMPKTAMSQQCLKLLTCSASAIPVLAGKDKELLKTSCRKFLLLYVGLEQQATQAGICAWRFKPKFHLMQGLAECIWRQGLWGKLISFF